MEIFKSVLVLGLVFVASSRSDEILSKNETSNPNIPDRKTCGFQDYNTRLVTGHNVDIDEFPWLALLQYETPSGKTKWSCQGIIISPRYVLTSAHCVTETRLGNLNKVRLGEWNLDADPDCVGENKFKRCVEPIEDVEIESLIPHPNYRSMKNIAHDIALIRLKKNVDFKINIRPICLPLLTDASSPGDRLTVFGWQLSNSKSSAKEKRDVNFKSRQSCNKSFSKYGVTIGDGQICVTEEESRDSCKDGGFLMGTSISNRSQWYVEGISSFGASCSQGLPEVYTKVSAYLDWIDDNVKG